MELVILGLKDKKSGEYLVYDVDNNQGRNAKHTEVEIGLEYNLPIVSPYPFSVFTSLDKHAKYWDKYEKCYLNVDADMSDEEYKRYDR